MTIDAIASDDVQTDAAVITKLAKMADGNVPSLTFTTPDGRTFAVTRDDFKLDNITPANKAEEFKPKHVIGNVMVQTAASMIDYVSRFKNADTVLFANIEKSMMVAAIDYHKAVAGAAPTAEFGSHNATLVLPFSDEWKTWTVVNEKLMSHIDFASFLEENAFDVIIPPGAELLEMCRDLQVKQDVNFGSSIRMGDTSSINYSKEGDVSSKGSIALPLSFSIMLPVYFGEPAVQMTAWIRRQISDGKLRLGYKLMRLEAVRQREFGRVVSEIKAGTGDLTTVYGAK